MVVVYLFVNFLEDVVDLIYQVFDHRKVNWNISVPRTILALDTFDLTRGFARFAFVRQHGSSIFSKATAMNAYFRPKPNGAIVAKRAIYSLYYFLRHDVLPLWGGSYPNPTFKVS